MKKLVFFVTLISALYCCPAFGQDQIEDYSIYIENKNIENEFVEQIKNGQSDPITKYCNASNVNIRVEPNTECGVIDQLNINTSVEVIAEYNGWSCITGEPEDTYKTAIAFVKSEFLSDEEVIEKTHIGKFKITHYCCEKYKHICGEGDGITKSGTPVRPGIVSVDPKIIPLGSKVMINGQVYLAEDTGAMIKGNKIDMCVETHQEALELGVYHANVYVIND